MDGEERIAPDYGLEDLAGLEDDDLDDDLNDDTFGDASTWEQGNEGALEMQRAHEQFLTGDMAALPPSVPSTAGGFFGDLSADGNFDMLEDDLMLPSLGDFDDDLALDPATAALIGSPGRVEQPLADPPKPAGGNRGLRSASFSGRLNNANGRYVCTSLLT